MQHRVEHRDDRVLSLNGVGDIDFPAVGVKKAAEPFREHRLAVARRSVDEQRTAGADRGADFIQHAGPNDEFGKRRREGGRITGHAGDRLPSTLRDILLQRHRYRTDVATLVKDFPRSQASQFRQGKAEGHAAHEIRTGDFNAPLIFKEPQGFIDDGKHQPNLMGDFLPDEAAVRVEQLEDHLGKLPEIEPRIGQCGGQPRRWGGCCSGCRCGFGLRSCRRLGRTLKHVGVEIVDLRSARDRFIGERCRCCRNGVRSARLQHFVGQ